MIFHDYSGFFKFRDFSTHGIFLSDFTGFPELVGNLHFQEISQTPSQVRTYKTAMTLFLSFSINCLTPS